MFERFGADVRQAVLLGAEEASLRRRDPRIGTEHLLIGTVAVGDDVATAHGLTGEALREQLRRLDAAALASVGVEADVTPLLDAPWPRRRRWYRLRPRGHVPFTRAAKSTLHRSLRICMGYGHRRINSSHLLAALVTGPAHDPAVRLIRAAGVDPLAIDADVRRALSA